MNIRNSKKSYARGAQCPRLPVAEVNMTSEQTYSSHAFGLVLTAFFISILILNAVTL